MSMDNKHKFKVISLFSGGMGLDLGLDSTDRYEIVACVEKEKVFCNTIRKNVAAGRMNPNLQIFEGDITDLDPAEVLKATGLKPGEVDLLVGGPPCQSFKHFVTKPMLGRYCYRNITGNTCHQDFRESVVLRAFSSAFHPPLQP